MNACLQKGDDCKAVNWKQVGLDGDQVWTCLLQKPGYGPMYDFVSVKSIKMCCLDKSCPGN